MTRVLVTLALVVSFAHGSTWGQTAEPLPKFDVASIKQDTSGEQPTNNWQPSPGRMYYQNSQILQLIRAAFGDYSLRVEGAPQWTIADRYDIDVRFPVGADNIARMLRQLLNDRFRMVAHIETRPTPIYSLVMARPDRSIGPKLQPAAPDCAPPPVLVQQTPPECRNQNNLAGGTMLMPYIDMAGLARVMTTMQGFLGRPVADDTRLAGFYRIELLFAPPPRPGADAPADSDRPSFFTALQEQLGLRLDSATGPVRFIVIDSIERPTPD